MQKRLFNLKGSFYKKPASRAFSVDKSQQYVISIDQGTTSTRALLISNGMKVMDGESREHEQISTQPGWVEHDPMKIYTNAVECLQAIMQRNGLTADHIKSVGITNQRETTVAYDQVTGEPLHNAIVWYDKRTSDIVKVVSSRFNGDVNMFRPHCGLPLNTYFSAVKMKWFLENCEKVQQAKKKGTLKFGTIDSWLIYKLTNHLNTLTDSSNASRTMLMDLEKLEWSDVMLSELGIDKNNLPEIIKSSSADYGTIKSVPELQGVTIGGAIGDQQGACLGHVLRPGQVKNTYGTGCFILQNVGEKPVQSTEGLLSTMCYRIGDKSYYALEGAVEIAGAGIQWAKKIGLITDVKKIEEEARSVQDCGDVYFVQAFQGIFAPYWRDDARGMLIGVGLNTQRGHLMRAMLEAPCLRSTEVVQSMSKDSGNRVKSIVVDGGMTVNDLLMQSQSDFANARIVRKQEKEITAMGAAIAAGLQSGFWESLESVEQTIKIDREFLPQMSEEDREKKLNRWAQAVERSIGFGWQ